MSEAVFQRQITNSGFILPLISSYRNSHISKCQGGCGDKPPGDRASQSSGTDCNVAAAPLCTITPHPTSSPRSCSYKPCLSSLLLLLILPCHYISHSSSLRIHSATHGKESYFTPLDKTCSLSVYNFSSEHRNRNKTQTILQELGLLGCFIYAALREMGNYTVRLNPSSL